MQEHSARPTAAAKTVAAIVNVGKSAALYAVLLTVAASMLLPFVWMVSTSLKRRDEVFRFPPEFIPSQPQWGNYPHVLTMPAAPFFLFFGNTLFVTLAVVAGQVFFCSLAAYAFARLRFVGRHALFLAFLATMMIPGQVTMIPTFSLVAKLGWINTYWALIVPGLSSAFGIFLLRQFFMTLPKDLEDAARVDGAGEWQVYRRIILPLSKPALMTLAVFTFMGTWTDFLWPLLMTNSLAMRTLEVGLAVFKTSFETDYPKQMTASVLVMLPVLLVYIFTQRYFTRGIALTGIKE